MSQQNTSGQVSADIRALIRSPETFPISFSYNNRQYTGFSTEFFRETARRTSADALRTTTEIVWSFQDELQVSLKWTEYPSYGGAEWTVFFENTTDRDSGVISELHTELSFSGESPVLRGILGDHENLYRPYERNLTQETVSFVSDSGRATHVYFPYFDLEYGDGGALLAIGWAGTWTADFAYADGAVRYTARSVNNLRTYLKPGETLRSALFVCLPYHVRDEFYAVNLWRRWYIECNLPKLNGEGAPLRPFSTCCLASDTGLPNSDGSISERCTTWRPSLEKMIAEDCKVDFRWFDAGWYSAPNGETVESDWWGTVGSWELDPVKWPGKTFRESTDFARAHGMRTLMWFEPERVTDPDSLKKNYGYCTDWAIRREGTPVITNNIGNPDCLRWTTERICKVLRENRVDMYREDNNSDPAPLWQYLDSREGENRLGITESKMILGHYRMWDDIIRCTLGFGGCGFVDSCASGGGRNDLESMRRGIPLLRSDNDRTSTALRLSMTTAFNRWIPFCGANTKEKLSQLAPTGVSDVYVWRASYLPALNVDSQFVQDPGQDFSVLRNGLHEWKKVNPYLLKDFYVLTPWHSEEDKSGFTAFCFFDPEQEKGVLFLFRMEECAQDTLTVRLPFAGKGASYLLTDEDSGAQEVLSGETHDFVLDTPRTARLVWIERK